MQLVTWHTEHLSCNIQRATGGMHHASERAPRRIQRAAGGMHHASERAPRRIQRAAGGMRRFVASDAPRSAVRLHAALGHSARKRLNPTAIRTQSLMQDGRQRDDLKQEWRVRHGSDVHEPW